MKIDGKVKKGLRGKLYKLGMDLNLDGIVYRKGTLVVYIEKDTRHVNSRWVLLPNGQRGSVWTGHLEISI